jgi:hypothetical protein
MPPGALDENSLPYRFGRYELQALLGEGGMGSVKGLSPRSGELT